MSPHTPESEELFRDFVQTLRRHASADGFGITKLYGHAQLLRVDGSRKGTLNVRTDAAKNGWWGFTKQVGMQLKKEGVKWFLVLLEARPGQGYLLSDVEVDSAKNRWSDAGAQYIIHPHNLRELWRFRGFEQMWSKVKARL